MKSNCYFQNLEIRKSLWTFEKKIPLFMKILIFYLFCSIGILQAAESYAQNTKVSISAEEETVANILENIEQTSEFDFFYNNRHVDLERRVTLSATNKDIFSILDAIFDGTDVKYTILDKKIILSTELKNSEKIEQKNIIRGRVIDINGEPIIGATVKEVGSTSNGTITDTEGNFSIEIHTEEMLEISFIGYKTEKIRVIPGQSLSVILKEDNEILDEVVVVGYGVQKKVNLTGSVSSIDFEKQAESRPITNVSNALAGMSAGVQVRQGSAQPGSDGSSILIRGIGTMNSNEPLVLIDGIEGDIDSVNPQDIESISVLKDAASSSIYGSRAASGVILITTKKGKADKLSVSYSGRFSYAQPTNLIEAVTNYADYMELMNESFENIGQSKHYNQSTIDLWREKSLDPNGLNENGVPNYVAYPNTDWQRVLFKHGIIHDHNISVNGGSEKIQAMLSAGYLDNPGIVDNTGIKRYSMRANVDAKITDWLTVGTRTFASLQTFDPGSFGTANDRLRTTNPGTYPMWNGKYGYPEAPEETTNTGTVLYVLDNIAGEKQQTRFNTTLYSSVRLLKKLSWDFNFNYQLYSLNTKQWTNPIERVRFSDGVVMQQAPAPSLMTTSFSNNSSYNYTLENIIRYNTSINNVHDIGAMIGYQEFYYKQETNAASKRGLIDSSVHTPSSASEMLSITGTATDRASRSFFGRINYAYKSKYLLEANLRRDGHSRYTPEHRWGTFPSFSAGWRISEEDFMEKSRNWLDNLKIRLSYGSLGNNGGNSVENYESQSTYALQSYPFGDVLTSGLAISALANPLLAWETSRMANFGIDANAFQNRLSLTLDAFYRKTTGILYTPAISLTAGNKTAPRKNIAEMSTKGVEITLGWQDKIGEVHYAISGNFSFTPNMVDYYKGKLKTTINEDENGNQYWTYANLGDVASNPNAVDPIIEGHTMNEYFLINPYKGTGKGFEADGIYGGPVDGMIRTEADMEWLQTMIAKGYTFRPNGSVSKDKIWYGDYIYADTNGDGTYGGSEDRTFQNFSSVPKYNFGLQMSAKWKDFDISMNWAGQAGFRLYWAPITGYNTPSTRLGYAIEKNIADNHYFYDPENPNDPRTNIYAKYGRLVASETGYQNSEASSLFLFNGNYLKLKNLTLGYTLPRNIIRKAYMSNLRVYLSIENVFSIDKYPGQDPELGATPTYTSLRQFAFGVNLSF